MCALCSNIFAAPTCIELGATDGSATVSQDNIDMQAVSVPPVFQPTYEVETTDFAASTATTGTLELGVTHYGSISASGDEDWYAIELVAGQTYEFRLHGVGLNQNPDPYLIVRDGTGNTILVQNDDAGGSLWGNGDNFDSRVLFTPSASGTYYVVADSFSTYSGDYILTAVEHNATGMEFTLDEIAWQLTNNGGFLFGQDVQAFDVGIDGELTVNITALTTEGQALARAALQQWSDLTGIQFVETSGTAEITFDDSDLGANAYANTVVSGTTITSATVMVTTDWLTMFGTGFNSYSYETYVHEIGHALGLFHGGNYNGSANYGTDNYYLNDSLAFSIMSYMQANGDEFGASFGWNTFVGADFRYMMTPVLADFIAIEMLYGRSTSTRTGNTTYGYGSNTGNTQLDNAVTYGSDVNFMVHDDGGIDTLNFSQSSANQTISLEADSLSSVLGGIYNMSISRGTVIENAIGGSGNDRIFGNSANNTQTGNAGNDTIFGSAGSDTLSGGAGFDTLNYAASNAAVQVFLGGNSASGGHATGDTISGFENLVGSAFNDRLFGSAQVNLIDGGSGDDIILGNNGNDTLRGREGRDIIYGGNQADTFVYRSITDSGLLFADRDRIQDFQNGQDRFDLSALDANTNLAGDQAFTYAGSTFTGTAGQLRSWEFGSLTFIEGDVNGDGVADFRIELLGTGLGIDATDFVL